MAASPWSSAKWAWAPDSTAYSQTRPLTSAHHRPLDIAILGQGYIPISMADGSVGFTRDGSLQIDGGGRLITTSGALVEPAITMPPNHRDLSIDRSGTVTARSNETDELVTLGQIRLVGLPILMA